MEASNISEKSGGDAEAPRNHFIPDERCGGQLRGKPWLDENLLGEKIIGGKRAWRPV
jgi:hypothetical protein